jgi:sugar transferase (PEP-CTERM/EpsH1 system associated)
MPYPPNKGDKVRSYHLLRHLAAGHRVWLGSFVDDPEDETHVDTLRQWCAELHLARLHPRSARLQSLPALLHDEPLTLRYYRDAGLAEWVRQAAERTRFDAVVVFSSSMVQYADQVPGVPMLIDFVDVDSAKWTQYAEHHRWPLSWLYRREGERLLAYERAAAARAARSFFAAEPEAELFRRLAPECAQRVEGIRNGVDADYFSPDESRPSPFEAGTMPVVFTGAMDYWPNVDAVTWFARDVLPRLVGRCPTLRFVIVGRSPAPSVQALAGDQVVVTGTVPDVRPYLQHAAVIVAPLRLARGIQNKVLEAMAMGRAVVATAACAAPIEAVEDRELLTASDAEGLAGQIEALLADPSRTKAVGQAARERVLRHFSWDAQWRAIDRHLAGDILEVAA